MRRSRFLALITILGCGSSDPVVPATEPVATAIVTPGATSLAARQTAQRTASLKDAASHAITGRLIEWRTTAGAIATISNSGVVSATTH